MEKCKLGDKNITVRPPCAVTFSWWGHCVPQWPG